MTIASVVVDSSVPPSSLRDPSVQPLVLAPPMEDEDPEEVTPAVANATAFDALAFPAAVMDEDGSGFYGDNTDDDLPPCIDDPF